MSISPIEEINQKLNLAKNLVWIAGVLFAATVGLLSWIIVLWGNLTNDFIKFGDEVRVQSRDSRNGVTYVLATNGKDAADENLYSVVGALPINQHTWTIEHPETN